MAPVPERRNPASLMLAILVHVAIGGIVWGLCLTATPPLPEAPQIVDWDGPLVFHPPAPPMRGDGGTKVRGPKVPTPLPVVEPPVVEAPPPTVIDARTDAMPSPTPVETATSRPGTDVSSGGEPTDREGPGGGDGPGKPGGPRGPGGPGDFGGASQDEPLILRGDMVAPVILERPDPEYPATCRRIGAYGTVVLRCIIDVHGAVHVQEVLKSNECLDAPAIAAVERWRYQPALWNGRPQSVFQTVRVTFR